MSNGFLDLNGTPMLMATGTKPMTIGTNGAGSLRFLANGTQYGEIASAGDRSEYRGLTNYTTAGNYSIVAAALASGLITRDPNGGARTDTFDTAANIIAGIPSLSYDGAVATCFYINTADAAEAITFAANTGVTISNVGQTLAQNESALLVIRRTSSTAVTIYIIGA